MTLIFSKNSKPDDRMVKYDQAVVRLGLERARVQKELDREKAKISEIEERKSELFGEIKEARIQLKGVRDEIDTAINESKKETGRLSQAQTETGQKVAQKKENMVQLEGYIVSLQNKVHNEQEALDNVSGKVEDRKKVLEEEDRKLNDVLDQKRSIELDIVSLQDLRMELKESIDSFEEKINYLGEKEQSLNRKEADLIKYEERIKKVRKEMGNNNPMIFKQDE